LGSFFAFLEDGGLSTASPKQHMAAVRMLFDHLVTGGVTAHNPALLVKAPRQKLGKGKTAGAHGRDTGIATEVCNHTFRGTGITAYLDNGGTLEKARQMAAHASTRTAQLYDRRGMVGPHGNGR
jgi:site-specific recombinase XerD